LSVPGNRPQTLQAITEIIGGAVEHRADREQKERQTGDQRSDDDYCHNDKKHLNPS
jgi:hypothetical protein